MMDMAQCIDHFRKGMMRGEREREREREKMNTDFLAGFSPNQSDINIY